MELFGLNRSKEDSGVWELHWEQSETLRRKTRWRRLKREGKIDILVVHGRISTFYVLMRENAFLAFESLLGSAPCLKSWNSWLITPSFSLPFYLILRCFSVDHRAADRVSR